MSSEVAVASLDSPARALALRIAFGMLLGFVLSAVFRLDFFFLPSLLAVQMLALIRRPPSLVQGAGIFFLFALLAVFTLVISSAFTRQPLIYITLTSLILFFGFLLDSAGKAMPATFVLMLGATIPIVVVQSTEAATMLSAELIGATAIALLTVWSVFAVFPSTAAASGTSVSQPASPRAALTNLLLLLPVLLLFLFDSNLSLVVVIVIVNIVRQRQRGMTSRIARGLLFGNVLGGVLATIAFFFISIRSGPIFFLLIVLLVGLMLGGRAAVASTKAPVYTVALASFVILLGLGVSPLPSETGSLFMERLINVLLAGVYAVSAIALVSPALDGSQEGQAETLELD